MKKILRMFIPPIILKIYFYVKNINRPELSRHNQYGWFGNYSSWSNALKACSNKSYASELILNKVKESLLKVKKGEAVYERDSYLFDKIIYSWPLLAGLLWVAGNTHNKLHVLDFGGSLGSSYYQNKSFLTHCKEFSWNIVEQKKFVKCGIENFQNSTLKFYYSIDACLKANKKVNILLLSGVIQYLEDPYGFIDKLLTYDIEYIIIDRTLIFDRNGIKDRLTVQKVPPQIYDANYPCWIFDENNLLKYFQKKYKSKADFIAHVGTKIDLKDAQAIYKGYILELKNN